MIGHGLAKKYEKNFAQETDWETMFLKLHKERDIKLCKKAKVFI
jgi:hypothetical protein